jgi:hypothetical protein
MAERDPRQDEDPVLDIDPPRRDCDHERRERQQPHGKPYPPDFERDVHPTHENQAQRSTE